MPRHRRPRPIPPKPRSRAAAVILAALSALLLAPLPILAAINWTQASWQVLTNSNGATLGGLMTDTPTFTFNTAPPSTLNQIILTRNFSVPANVTQQITANWGPKLPNGGITVTSGSITINISASDTIGNAYVYTPTAGTVYNKSDTPNNTQFSNFKTFGPNVSGLTCEMVITITFAANTAYSASQYTIGFTSP